MSQAPLRLTHLEVRNVGGIRAIATDLGPGLNVVTGKNGSGKSCLISALSALFTGRKGMPPVPIRTGSRKATVKGQLVTVEGEVPAYSVEIEQTQGGFRIKLSDAEGTKMASPSKVLKALAGWAGSDPVELAWTKDQKEIRVKLLEAIGVDVEAIDTREENLRETRRDIGREKKRAEAAAESRTFTPGLPDEVPSTADLMKAYENARTTCAKRAELNGAIDHAQSEIASMKAIIERSMDALSSLPESDDVDVTRVALESAQENSAKITANKALRILEKETQEYATTYDDLTEQIEALDEARATALRDAGLGDVDGLVLSGDAVTLHGQPWEAASDGQRLKAALDIRAVSSPPLHVAWSKRGSDLDTDNLALVSKLCQEQGLQLVLERVGGDGDGDLLIVEGALVDQEERAF